MTLDFHWVAWRKGILSRLTNKAAISLRTVTGQGFYSCRSRCYFTHIKYNAIKNLTMYTCSKDTLKIEIVLFVFQCSPMQATLNLLYLHSKEECIMVLNVFWKINKNASVNCVIILSLLPILNFMATTHGDHYTVSKWVKTPILSETLNPPPQQSWECPCEKPLTEIGSFL